MLTGKRGPCVTVGVLATLMALPAVASGGHPQVPQAELPAPKIERSEVAAARVQRSAQPRLDAAPEADCGPGSRPETGVQGRVSRAEHESGRAADGYTCNTELVGRFGEETPFGTIGGFKVERYVDAAGHDCAYYDTTLTYPTNIFDEEAGVNVLDMRDPSKPVRTARLLTPAMLSPHESLVLNQKRGLLAAVAGNAAFNVGIVDVYDISKDCRNPVLKSSTPVGVFGHESGMAPDGRTFYSASPSTETIVAVDISNPSLARPIWAGRYDSHGLSISDDGNRAYVAGTGSGLIILDTSQVQSRVPNPEVREVARLTWESMSIPQNALPITIKGHPYVVEIDEYGGTQATGGKIGAGRIIDIADETRPRVVSDLRLGIHQPANLAAAGGDPGANLPVQGYGGHYCNVPQRADPGIVACSMILSGLRVFDIRDPLRPRETAYFNAPIPPRSTPAFEASNWAMASPSFVPDRREIWYSDGYSGFYSVRVTNGAWASAGGQGEESPSDAPAGKGGDADGEKGATPAADETERSGGAKPGGTAATADGGALPFTGLELAAIVLSGLLAILVGLGLRRRLGHG